MLAITYSDDNRGSIQFRERRKQIIDFSGLRYGNITPTDCDGFIEYQNKAYVLFEIKYRDAKVPHGQSLALTRSVDDYVSAGKKALLIIAQHEVDDPNQDINAAKCSVRDFYFKGKWHKPKDSITLKDAIDKFITYFKEEIT